MPLESNFTNSQISKIRSALKRNAPVRVKISYKSLRQDGSGFIITLLPMLAKATKFVFQALAVGVLGGAASGLAERLVGSKK